MKQGMDHGAMKPGMQMSDASMETSQYRMFGLNMALSLVIMYFVMFTMIYSLGEFYNNLNMFYMALMMAAPMGVLMLWLMNSMFRVSVVIKRSFRSICGVPGGGCWPR